MTKSAFDSGSSCKIATFVKRAANALIMMFALSPPAVTTTMRPLCSALDSAPFQISRYTSADRDKNLRQMGFEVRCAAGQRRKYAVDTLVQP
ncbi:hypothetical protein [Sinorhizobium meliloti]|uniref:hypothetical protein n=1 Tax=Rhizobium meliloti TaxID=382 RepID=UPI001F177D13|nr:hypothetical protein [Sinorhizobium meliloti]